MDRLDHVPFAGFEYLERAYADTRPGPGHGSIVYWQEGLPENWELRTGDRAAVIAPDLRAFFAQLTLERDPWAPGDSDTGGDMAALIDELGTGGPGERAAAAKLRAIVLGAVLDWRGAIDDGTIAGQGRLRRLALRRAAEENDVDLLARLASLGCDPGEAVRGGLTPIDVALLNRSPDAAWWLLGRGVAVTNTLRLGAHAVDLPLARELLARGAEVTVQAVSRAFDNADIEVTRVIGVGLSDAVPRKDLDLHMRMLAKQAEIAAGRAPADEPARRRATVLREIINRHA